MQTAGGERTCFSHKDFSSMSNAYSFLKNWNKRKHTHGKALWKDWY